MEKSPKGSNAGRRPDASKKKGSGSSRLKTILQWLTFLVGLCAVVALFASAPREKRLVCKDRVIGKKSLTTFGTCTKE